MAYTASQPVKEVPGFARVGEAIRKGVLKVTTPLFGTPENPTTFGKVMTFIDEAAAYGTMAGPAAAVGRMRFAAHPVRGPRIVDARFLGSETLPLSNRLAASGTVAAPKSMFSNSPGGIAMVARDGNVILPREADVRLYRSEHIRLPNGRSVPLSDIPAIASNIDASSASLAQKQAAVAKLNEAATPYWMYWMYEKDIADANATLARFRSGGRWYDNANVRNYDVLARGDAATVVGNPIGTRYQVGQTVFSPNHVSAMSRDRFIKDPRLFDVYNDGYLPYQSMTFTAAPKLVKGKPVTPVMRATDHHETVRGPTGSLMYGGSDLKLPHTEYRTYDRTYHVGRDIPYFNFKANEPGGVDLMYMLDNGTPVVRNQGSYSASVAVQQASKGGDSPHRNFRNFLATDEVPDSIFGYPVVQREEDYTPEDLEFFRKNPKAAGFYDTGEDDGGVEDQEDLLGGVARRFRETGEVLSDLYEMSGLKKRVGEAGEVADAGLAWFERQAKQAADMDVPVLSAAAKVLNPASVGARAAIAKVASDGGRAYRPEVRDERYFSNDALRSIAKSLPSRGSSGRTELSFGERGTTFLGNLEASQAVGGYSVRNGRVTDTFDINKKYDVVPQWMTETARFLFGRDSDPDGGKVRTEIPLDRLHRSADKGGKARPVDEPTLSDEDRPMYFYRDKQGKITGYGTTRSMVHEDNGKFFVIPTIIDNGDGTSRLVGDDDAIGWYAETGEHWGSYRTREAAEAASKARSAKHAQMYREDWNEYIQDHWDDMSPEIQRDPGSLRLHTLRTGAYPGNLNNPGNVKAFGKQPAGVDPKNPKKTSPVDPKLTFWRFLTPEAGLDAAADTVVDIIENPKKMNRAPFTIENFVRHYAPSTENDTEAYIKDMVSFTGFARDAVMDRNDPKQMATLLKALVRRDSGNPHSDWFPRTTYRRAAERLKEKEGD